MKVTENIELPDEHIDIPVVYNFDQEELVGVLSLFEKDVVNPDSMITFGFKVIEKVGDVITKFELLEASIITENYYQEYLKRKESLKSGERVYCVEIIREFSEDNLVTHYRADKKKTENELSKWLREEHYFDMDMDEIYKIKHYQV